MCSLPSTLEAVVNHSSTKAQGCARPCISWYSRLHIHTIYLQDDSNITRDTEQALLHF